LEKESYSIDEILSEVKKRREENEKALKEAENKQEAEKEQPIETVEETEQATEEDDVEEEIINESPKQEDKIDEEIDEELDEPVEEPTEEEPQEEIESEEPEVQEDVTETEIEQDEEGLVDLLSMSQQVEDEPQEEQPQEKVGFFKTKKGKTLKKVIITLLVIILALALLVVVGGWIYIHKTADSISDSNSSNTTEDSWEGMSTYIENFPEIYETEASQLSSLQDMIKTWYYNGSPASSTHVLNVLLIGEDTRTEEILDDETRADAAIIASVNIDTGKITLTSVLRDTYAYWENTPGDETTGEFGKINAAMATGGVDVYINAIEQLYKIDIDNYVIVNFDSFENIIDELGGVYLELTSAEINEINNHPSRYGDVYIEKTFDGDSGTLLLDGSQALAYCRIRYIDSDNARANRQKACLYEIFSEVQDVSTVTQLKVVKALLPYVNTGFSSDEIISIVKYALSKGWLDYDVQMVTVPYSRINEKGAGGTYYGAWCWKSDFPQDANYLQTTIYERTSVFLAEVRVDILNCNLYGFYNETLVPCYATITNLEYGVTTTYPSLDEEETTTSN
jgi:LCP family protein required for cell wall assembly